MGDTSISWTDKTWNPVRGCSRVSEGCRNCYAERMAGRFAGPGQPYHGLVNLARSPAVSTGRIGDPRWNSEVRFIADRLADPLRWKKPRRIFVNSMSDLFHEKLTNEQIAAVFGVMAAAPQHTFQVLTKRARRMREWFEWMARTDAEGMMVDRDIAQYIDDAACDALAGHFDCCHLGLTTTAFRWPLPNVWIGVSVENQGAASERIPELIATPAIVRFLSCEPLLERVLLDDGCSSWLSCDGPTATDDEAACCESRYVNGSCFHGIDWVIGGCESGPGARQCDVDWLRALRDQCATAGVPYFLKQATGILPNAMVAGSGSEIKGGGVIELPYLDGVQHAEFPIVDRSGHP